MPEAGRQKERAITEQFLKLEDTVFEGINEKDRAHMRELFHQILRNMTDKT